MQSNKTANYVGTPHHLFDNIFHFPTGRRVPGPRISRYHLRYADWFDDADKAWVMIRRLMELEEINPEGFDLADKYIHRSLKKALAADGKGPKEKGGPKRQSGPNRSDGRSFTDNQPQQFKDPSAVQYIIEQMAEIDKICPAVLDNVGNYVATALETLRQFPAK